LQGREGERERGRKRGREREGEGREREKVGGRAGGGKNCITQDSA